MKDFDFFLNYWYPTSMIYQEKRPIYNERISNVNYYRHHFHKNRFRYHNNSNWSIDSRSEGTLHASPSRPKSRETLRNAKQESSKHANEPTHMSKYTAALEPKLDEYDLHKNKELKRKRESSSFSPSPKSKLVNDSFSSCHPLVLEPSVVSDKSFNSNKTSSTISLATLEANSTLFCEISFNSRSKRIVHYKANGHSNNFPLKITENMV